MATNKTGNETIQEGKSTSLDVLWRQWFQEIDSWNERITFREETMLKSAKHLASNVSQRQETLQELVNKYVEEQKDIERTAREELLSFTTGFQYLFPIKSYEEINNVLQNIQQKASELSSMPWRTYSQEASSEKVIDMMEKYIEFRRKSREQFIASLKETAEVIQDNQKTVVDLFQKQVRNVFFPVHKFMERSTERA